MPVNTEHNPSNVVITRISRVSQPERTWIEALHRSGLDLRDFFTAKEAVDAIANTPLSNGGQRLHIPNSNKLCFVMRKTKRFERMRQGNETGKIFWRLYNDR